MMSTSTSGSSSRMSTCTSGFTQHAAISPRLSSSSNGWHCQSINEPLFAVQFYGVSTPIVISKDNTTITFDKSGIGAAIILICGALEQWAMDSETAQLAI